MGPSARELSSTPLPQQLLVVCSQGGDAEHLQVDFVMLVANFISVVICLEKFADIAVFETVHLPAAKQRLLNSLNCPSSHVGNEFLNILVKTTRLDNSRLQCYSALKTV